MRKRLLQEATDIIYSQQATIESQHAAIAELVAKVEAQKAIIQVLKEKETPPQPVFWHFSNN